MSEIAVSIDSVTKDFSAGLRLRKVRALDGVTLQIAAGQIYALLGPNGSGKSTLLKLMAGLSQASSGHIRIFDQRAGCLKNRARIGYMPDQPNYERFLSGWELLKFYARMHGLPAKYAQMRIEAVLNMVDLQAVKHRKLGRYSKGMLQRLGLAQVMIHEPDLLLLDEPISGMDPIAHEAMLKILIGLRDAGKTIIISSHRLDLMPRFCDRFALMYRGRLLAEHFANRWIAQADGRVTIAGLDSDQRAKVAEVVAGMEGACLVDENEALPDLQDWFLQTLSAREQL
jgi:ABC-2 type transport system ATP-binding protein